MSIMSPPLFISRWATSFSWPFGGSFNSSTKPFILVSVAGSYLGGWACAADKPLHKRIAEVAKIAGRKILYTQTAPEPLEKRMASLLLAAEDSGTGLTQPRPSCQIRLARIQPVGKLETSYYSLLCRSSNYACGLTEMEARVGIEPTYKGF